MMNLHIQEPTDTDDAAIVGSIEALCELRDLLDDAMRFGLSSSGDFQSRDGRHYVLLVTPRRESEAE